MAHEKKPCAGCGYCCSNRICRLGAMIFGHYKKPCPGLKREGDRYLCGLYLSDPDRYGLLLEIGHGCCAPENDRQ